MGYNECNYSYNSDIIHYIHNNVMGYGIMYHYSITCPFSHYMSPVSFIYFIPYIYISLLWLLNIGSNGLDPSYFYNLFCGYLEGLGTLW